MAEEWPFVEWRLKSILQSVVKHVQRKREGVYSWLTEESLDEEIDKFLEDPSQHDFLKSFADGEHELAIHFLKLHPAKLMQTCEEFVASAIKWTLKQKEDFRLLRKSSFGPGRFKVQQQEDEQGAAEAQDAGAAAPTTGSCEPPCKKQKLCVLQYRNRMLRNRIWRDDDDAHSVLPDVIILRNGDSVQEDNAQMPARLWVPREGTSQERAAAQGCHVSPEELLRRGAPSPDNA